MTSSTTRAFMAKKPFATASAFMAKTNQLLSTMASLRLLLVIFLTLIVSAEVWGQTWTRVTTMEQLTSGGTFIMGYEATAKSGTIVPLRSADCDATTSANGYFHTGTTANSSTSSTITMSSVVNTSAYEVYISSPASGMINIQRATSTGNYYGASSGGTSKNTARLYTKGNTTETNLIVEWASETNNQFKLRSGVSGTYKYLKYNTGSPRFAFYNSAGEKIVFYKKSATSFTVTATSNNNTYGTVSLSGTTITAAPKTGYRVSTTTPYTISPSNSAKVAQNGNTFTVTPSANTTITINFEAIPKYTVTLVPGSGSVTSTTLAETSAGAGVTLPTPTLDGCDEWSFAGWKTTSAVTTETTTEPTLIPAGAYNPASNITLYAVYQRTETTNGGGNSVSESITIVPNTFPDKGTSSYASGAERTGAVNEISLGGHYITGNQNNTPTGSKAGTYLQCQAKNATIYNKTKLPGNITKVVINQYDAKAFSLYCGSEQLMASNNTLTEQTPSGTKINDVTAATKMTWDVSGDYTYFALKKGSNTGYVTSIVITYQTDGGQSETTYYHSTPECITQPSITLHANDGTNDKTYITTGEKTYTVPSCSFTRTGYNFVKWNTQEDGKGTDYAVGSTINLDGTAVNLYAIWECKTITIEATSTGWFSLSIDKESVQSPIDNCGQENLTITIVPGDGYKVESVTNTPPDDITVYIDPNGKSADVSYPKNNTIVSEVTLALREYTITYHLNGGSGVKDATYTIESSDITLPTPTHEQGLTFAGWYQYEDFTEDPVTVITKGSTGDKVFYAKWEKSTPTFAWSAASYTAALEANNTFPTLNNPNSLSVTYTSSNTSVATIDVNGNITLVATGTTIITATGAETATHKSATATYELTVVASNCKWVETDIANINSGDEVIVTMTNGTITWALSDHNGTSDAPDAIKMLVDGVEIYSPYFAPEVDMNEVEINNIIWNIEKGDDNKFIFHPIGKPTYNLYCNTAENNNNRVRVGNSNNAILYHKFVIEDNLLKNAETSHYLGIYQEQDWRGYAKSSQFAGQTLKFYKKECLDSETYWVEGNLTNVACTQTLPQQIVKNGSVTLKFAAADGYALPDNVTVNNASKTWDKSTGTLTISNPTANVTITIEALKLHTVTWMVGSSSVLTEEVANGTGVTQTPTNNPEDGAIGSCANKFMGWSEKSAGSTPQDAAYYDDLCTAAQMIAKYPSITSNKTFYAVFATPAGGGGANEYVYIGDNKELTIGKKYIFVSSKVAGDAFVLKASDLPTTGNGTKGSAVSVVAVNKSDKIVVADINVDWEFETIQSGEDYVLRVVSSDTETKYLYINGSGVGYRDSYSRAYYDETGLYGWNNNGDKWYDIYYDNTTQKFIQKENASSRVYAYEKSVTTSISYSDYTTTCDATKAKVTYDLNGGEYESDDCVSQTVTKGQPFNLCSNTPTKNGYTFAGWSDGTKTYAAGAEVTISESTTFYASWKANTITITWDLNYTDCPEAETSTYVYNGDEIEMPEDPIRKGYKFTGWFTESSDGKQITEVGETNKPSSDVTYYAHWDEQYTVTYFASGQQYLKQEHKYISGDKLVLPEIDPSAANFACDGYLFEGWSKYQQTKEDANCPELVDDNTSVENDLELHAVWKKASTSGAGTQIFYESFDTEEGTGANDGDWGNDVGTETLVNDTWTFANGYGAYQCVKLGSSKYKGSATTPALTQLSGDATLSFKAAAWVNNNENTTLKLSISGGGTLNPSSVIMSKGKWTTYEVQITNGTPSSKITFEAENAASNRFFLDEVMITTSGSYNYTTSPNCGPTMVAKENVWATSATGQSVKVNVPLGIKLFEGDATIIGTSTNENFVVNTLENAGNGEHNLVVAYTPTAVDTKENTTITLTAKNGEEIWCTTTFTLNGRSLPTEFVVVANRGDKNYALPANMTEANTYPGLEVEVNGNEVTAAPMSHLYIARAVHSTRFDENGTAIRLVGNNDACLWASNAASGTHIRNFAQQSNAKSENYEWNLYTEDGDTYYISSTAVTEEGRVLRLDGTNFGMYKQGVDAFRLLPVGCTSTPMNVQTSATRTSATISWTNAGECNVVVKQGSTTVQSISAAASPLVVGNLAESTTYTFTLTPTDDASCGTEGSFTTTGPTIDIVEWQTGGIRIYVDKDENVNPKVIINGEEEHGNVGGQVATELFFSKYYEAHAENKLLAVYNGTTQTIDLNGYVIKHGTVEIDLSQYGQTKGSIASNEEIILVSFDNDATKSAKSCAEKEEGFSSWNVLGTSDLAFSGRGSVGLYKNDVLIDLIGSTYPSGELTKIGKAGKPDYCGTEDDVQLHIGGVSVNDQSSFFCYDGDNIKTPEVETDYPISTNRCLLIRKNTVTSGATAVTSNKAEAGATCGDLSSTFTTLCTEWSGFRIGSGSSSTAEIQDATCEGLGYVGGFDYNNYYRTMETIHTGQPLDKYDKNPNDNTYFIEFEVPEYSCLNIQLQLTDNDGNVLADQISQVPILVGGKKTTTDEIFSAIVKNGETPDYENSKIRCATCDVVILQSATLTKAAPETPKDVNQVRDIYVYPGGKLIVPEGAHDYSVNSISLRRDQDDVSTASILTPLNITSSSKTPVYVDIRINSENWHWMALPYDCNIADVTWKDGSKAIYNSDWFLMYYDGESRSKEQSHYENHWKVFEGTTIEAGKGYIVGITGHPTKSGVQYELRFPMPTDVLTADNQDKTVPVNSWGIEDDITVNKKGWNLVGNPYLDYYQRSAVNSFNGLRLGGEYEYDETTGKWHDTGMWNGTEKNLPYIVVPVDGGWISYDQVLASEIDLKPFTSYFVQVGNSGDTNGQQYDVQFEPANRGRASLIQRAPSKVDEVEEPIIVGVTLSNSLGESDKTSLVIDNQYTDEYEMNADFFKWFGDYYTYYTKPVLYTVGADQGKRAFNALNEELATQPVALGMYAAQAGEYTFTLDLRSDLSHVEEIWLHDATENIYTNLLQDSYTFSTGKINGEGRFFLSVKMKPQQEPNPDPEPTPDPTPDSDPETSLDDIVANRVFATVKDNVIYISGLLSDAQLWIYDAAGRLMHYDQTKYYQHTYLVPQGGAYFVRVQGTMQTQTIKVVVK